MAQYSYQTELSTRASASFYITLSDFYLMFLPWYKIVLIKSWLPRCDEECRWNTPGYTLQREAHNHWHWQGSGGVVGSQEAIATQIIARSSWPGIQGPKILSEFARWGSDIWLIMIGQIKRYIKQEILSDQALVKVWSGQLVRWGGDPRPRGLTSTDLINEAAECRHGAQHPPASHRQPGPGGIMENILILSHAGERFLLKYVCKDMVTIFPFLWCSPFLLCTSTTGNVI